MKTATPAPLPRALTVWGIGILGYVIAVAGRTSLGVAGVQAVDRFDLGASMLSAFAMVQLAVYAAAQIPVGLLIDRFGSRLVIASGVSVQAVGQILLALVVDVGPALVARVLIGLGDAAVLISVLRLIPHWFRPRAAPLLIQLTGMLGQIGQVFSAIPFLAVLVGLGWTPAFTMLGLIGIVAAALVVVIVRNRPRATGEAPPPAGHDALPVRESLARLFREPGAWLGLFAHYITLFPASVFLLLWGVPFLTLGHHVSNEEVGVLFTISTIAGFAIAPVFGELCARHPSSRSWFMLGSGVIMVLVWTTVLVPDHPLPFWHLVILLVAESIGTAVCSMGFDFPRTLVSERYLGAANGMVNLGGYTATVVSVIIVGAVLDLRQPSGEFTLLDFRWAFTALLPVFLVGVVGLLLSRRAVRRRYGVTA